MSDTRDDIAQIIHRAMCYEGWEECLEFGGKCASAADDLAAAYLVIPRTEVTTEYGWQYFCNGHWETVETEDRQRAIDDAAYQRDSEGEEWPKPARAVEHLTTAWSPISLPEDGTE